MDQTVNLTSLTSVVRIYLFPPQETCHFGGFFVVFMGFKADSTTIFVLFKGKGEKSHSLIILQWSRFFAFSLKIL